MLLCLIFQTLFDSNCSGFRCGLQTEPLSPGKCDAHGAFASYLFPRKSCSPLSIFNEAASSNIQKCQRWGRQLKWASLFSSVLPKIWNGLNFSGLSAFLSSFTSNYPARAFELSLLGTSGFLTPAQALLKLFCFSNWAYRATIFSNKLFKCLTCDHASFFWQDICKVLEKPGPDIYGVAVLMLYGPEFRPGLSGLSKARSSSNTKCS